MNEAFRKIKYIPIIIGLIYLTLTFILFFWGPFDWPINNPDELSFFLVTCVLGLTLGFYFGVHKRTQQNKLDSWRFFFRVGALSNIILLFPSTYAYTGKWPWDLPSVIANQGEAYTEMLAALAADESGIRAYVAIVRALFAPFVFSVVPLCLLNWNRMRRLDIALFFVHLSAVLIFSFMRGTDRETGDLVFFVFGTILLIACRKLLDRGKFTFKLSQAVILPVLLSIIFVSAFSLFIDRKESRMGGGEAFCIAEGVVCSVRGKVDSPLVQKAMFGIEMVSAYLSQGYYGLSLALKQEFTWTFGLGHSAFLTGLVTKLVDSSVYERGYLYKERLSGWDDRYQWSSIFPWIASDFTFPMVPLIMCGIGVLWGAAWRSAVYGKNDASALVYLFISLLVIYIPANNQITQTLDSYFSFLFWLFFWVGQRNNKIRLSISS